MANFKTLLAATAVVCAFATPTFAQDTMMSEKQILNLQDGHTLHVGASGKIKRLKGNKEANASIVAKGTVVPAGTIFHWSGGKMYMMQDTKMEDGKMQSDRFGDFGA